MTERVDGISSHFDAFAPAYNQNSLDHGWRSNEVFGSVLNELDHTPDSYLDLGSGGGATIIEALKHVTPQKIVAVDASAKMADSLVSLNPAGCEYLVKRGDTIAFLEETHETFDLISAVSVVAFEPEPRHLLTAVAERMRKFGRIIFTYDPKIDGHAVQGSASTLIENKSAGTAVTIYRHSPQAMQRFVTQAGLTVVQHELYAASKARPNLISGIIAAAMT